MFVNDTSLPRLRLSRAYREVARDKNKFKGENKEFISSKAQLGELDDPGDRTAPPDDAQGDELYREPAA